MHWIFDQRISTKLICAFLLMAALVGVIGIRGIQNMQKLNDEIVSTFRDHLAPQQALATASTAYQHSRLARMEMTLSTADPSAYAEFERKVNEDFRTIDEGLATFRKGAMDADEEALMRELEPDIAAARNNFVKLKQVLENGALDAEARKQEGFRMQVDPSVRQTASRIRETFNKLIEKQNTDAAAAQADANRTYQSQRQMFIGIVVLGVLAAFIGGIVISRLITNPLQEFRAALERLARGDLTVPQLDVRRRDELGDLSRTLVATIETQRKLIGEIKSSSSQVASSADEISASAVQITKGAENQSASTDETSSTMVEMAAQIDNVARSAQSLAANVDETSSSIQEMGASIEQMAKNAEALLGSVEETSTTIDQMTSSIRSVRTR